MIKGFKTRHYKKNYTFKVFIKPFLTIFYHFYHFLHFDEFNKKIEIILKFHFDHSSPFLTVIKVKLVEKPAR